MTKGREWIVKEELARGHTVGCHTVDHPLMTRLSSVKWKWEIDRCVKDVEKITGQKIKLFRFPYGASTWEMEEYANSKGLKTVLWNIDSLDWKKTPEEELKHLKWGIDTQKRGIVLFHDIQKSTVEALPEILRFLSDRKSKLILIEKNGR
jgi:peptidoglycan/xylan/chitin deacetylase (PgdA/CDA1 family)